MKANILQERSVYARGGICRTRIAWILIPMSSTCCFSSAPAQVRSGNERAIEEVIVTAQKREERLLDVPISISALTGDKLDSTSEKGLLYALNKVPSVIAVEAPGGLGTQITIRGVGSQCSCPGAGSSPVAYYIDGMPFGQVAKAYVPDIGLYDLDRVEILRGPQGTLYGANAQTGVVRVLTHDPDLAEFGFKARTSAAHTDGGDPSYRGDMAMNFPLIEGKLGARIIAGYHDLGGWIDSPVKSDVNDERRTNVRLKLKAQPTDALTIGTTAWYSRNDSGSPNASDDNERRSSLIDEPIAVDFDVYGLSVGYDFGGLQLESESSYFRQTFDDTFDILPFGIPLYFSINSEIEVLSQELRISSDEEGPWRWSLGGFYRDANDDLPQTIYFHTPGISPSLLVNDRSTSEAMAAFGELTRSFLEGRLLLTGGLRYFRDRVSMEELVRSADEGPAGLINTTRTFEKTSPRVVLTWHPKSDTTLYASYAEGFRSGFEQTSRVTRLTDGRIGSVKPDDLVNYELGAKGRILGGLVEIEAAAFYVELTDVQQTGILADPFVGAITTSLNGPPASGPGGELLLSIRPARGLTLSANVSYNDIRVDEDAVGYLAMFQKGDRLNFSPEYTAGASLSYDFPLWGATGHFSLSGTYQSEYQFFLTGYREIHSEDRTIANAEFGVETSNKWAMSVFVDNLGDTYTPGFGAPTTPPDQFQRPRPRTIGVQLEYRY